MAKAVGHRAAGDVFIYRLSRAPVLIVGFWICAWRHGEANLAELIPDPSNAVQPNANVTALEVSTGRQYRRVTDLLAAFRLHNMQRPAQNACGRPARNSVRFPRGRLKGEFS
jgi:hypothetical protein